MLQKSREKNQQLEDLHRRNEANIRRKAAAPNPLSSTALSDTSDAPRSPANTGAMDDLLKKLRDAKPEARDQRDRRRRARLKDRHQVRVASGQKMPEIGVNVEDEEEEETAKGMLSPTSEGSETTPSAVVASPPETASADVDVADRAAALLEGLQGGSSTSKDGSLVIRRRRENADSERERRRRRRQQASTASSVRSDDAGLMSPTAIPEEGEDPVLRRGSIVSGDGSEDGGPPTPITIVSPPSPEGKRDGRKLPTPPPES